MLLCCIYIFEATQYQLNHVEPMMANLASIHTLTTDILKVPYVFIGLDTFDEFMNKVDT
jgi:hypothetical protein